MTIRDRLPPSRLTFPFMSIPGTVCNTIVCQLCSYGSPESLVCATRQVHLLQHVVMHHLAWWLGLDWEDEIPPARYRHWRQSKFFTRLGHAEGELFSSDSEDTLVDIWNKCDPQHCTDAVHSLTPGISTPGENNEDDILR